MLIFKVAKFALKHPLLTHGALVNTDLLYYLGIFLAIAIVVLSDMLNTKVRNAEEVEELLGVPVIGRMPTAKGGK